MLNIQQAITAVGGLGTAAFGGITDPEQQIPPSENIPQNDSTPLPRSPGFKQAFSASFVSGHFE